MAVEYAVWLCDDVGKRIQPIDNIIFMEYVKVVNAPGWFTVQTGQEFDPALLALDRQIHIERRPRYRDRMSIDFVGFLRHWQYLHEASVTQFVLSGPDQNEFLQRRIVAYAAGTDNAQTSKAADDGLKDIFETNFLGSATDSDRDISGLGGGVTVQSDAGDGPTITKGFSWRNVHMVMTEIAEAAKTAGTEVFFELAVNDVDEDTGQLSFEFRTTANKPGLDSTDSSGLPPVIFGRKFGNITAVSLSYDYREEYNYVYAGGQGEGAKRYIAESSNQERIDASTWNRRELFADARNEEANNAVDDVADAKLAENRPRIRFEATIQDTEQARYGIDWRLGDKVTIREFGRKFDGFIRRVHIKFDNGQEDINVKVIGENV